MDTKEKHDILDLIDKNTIKQLRIACPDKYTVVQYKINGDYAIISRDNRGEFKLKMGGLLIGKITVNDSKVSVQDKIDMMAIYAAAEQKYYTQNISR